jgi:hypothetical protein
MARYDFTSKEARKQRLEEGWYCEWHEDDEGPTSRPKDFAPLQDPRIHPSYSSGGPNLNYIGNHTSKPWYGRFSSKQEVHDFIHARAKEGSELHIAALTLLVRRKFKNESSD